MNKDRTHARQTEKYVCDVCGGHYTRTNKAKHNGSIKHTTAASNTESSSSSSASSSDSLV